jgi:3-oxoadipate enol-lactonase
MDEITRDLFIEPPQGKGETLVLVHGLGGSTNTWFPQMQVLRRDFRVVAYDLAGSGRSPVAGGMSIDRHLADLQQIVAHAGHGQVHLAGHSMGTIICQHFAASHPDLVASLVLVGGFPEPPAGARTALRERAAKARREGMSAIADAIPVRARARGCTGIARARRTVCRESQRQP